MMGDTTRMGLGWAAARPGPSSLEVGISVIQPVNCVRDLGVHLDSELTMKTHISKVV